CTNSWTGDTDLWNMDLDVYDISNDVDQGDTSLSVQLRSGQDGIIVNCIAVSLSSEFPDVIVSMDADTFCASKEVTVSYTIENTSDILILPANTPIAFYADGILVETSAIEEDILGGESGSGEITLTIPEDIPFTFTLEMVVYDDGTGTTEEADEMYNQTEIIVMIPSGESPITGIPRNLRNCKITVEEGGEEVEGAYFNLADIQPDFMLNDEYTYEYYLSSDDASARQNALDVDDIENYFLPYNGGAPQTIWVDI